MSNIMNKGKRAAIYCRVSSEKQAGEDKTSLATQEAACRDYCLKQGYYAVKESHIFIDVHTGAELWQRPQLSRLRESVARREVDVVVAYCVDRLSRDVGKLWILTEEFSKHGCRLEFATEQFEDTGMGKLLFGIQGALAEIEREKISERTMRGKMAWLDGTRLSVWTFDLFGYRHCRDANGKKLGRREVHEPEAIIVREVYNSVAAGISLSEICRRFVDRGIEPPSVIRKMNYKDGRSPQWHPTQLRKILQNPAYRGVSVLGRQRIEERALKTRPDEVRKRLIETPEGEWQILPGELTPAIVTPLLWEQANERLKVNRGEWLKNQVNPRLLRGRIECLACESRMSPEKASGGRYGSAYRCSGQRGKAKHCTGGRRRVRAEHVESWVWQHVVEILKDPEVIQAELDRRRTQAADTTSSTEQKAQLEREIKRCGEGISRLLRKYAESGKEAIWKAIQLEIERFEDEKSRLQTELDQVIAQLDERQRLIVDLRAIQRTIHEYRERLDTADFAERCHILDSLGVQVRASDQHWEMMLLVPLGEPSEVLHHASRRPGQVDTSLTLDLRDEPVVGAAYTSSARGGGPSAPASARDPGPPDAGGRRVRRSSPRLHR